MCPFNFFPSETQWYKVASQTSHSYWWPLNLEGKEALDADFPLVAHRVHTV